MIHLIEISPEYFDLIDSDQKTVEGRKMTAKWMKLQKGDILEFVSENRKCIRRITKINYYLPGSELDPLTKFLLKEQSQALPNIIGLEEGKKVYLSWSTQEEINKVGFMGIHLSVLQNINL